MNQFTKTAMALLTGIVVVNAGPAEVLINQLKPPTVRGDEVSRTSLRQMSRDVMIPPIDAARRLVHENDLIKGMNTTTINVDTRADLMRELALAGKETAIPELAKYLADPKLANPSLMAILAICLTSDCTEGRKAISAAMPLVSDSKILSNLIQAAGTVRVTDPAVIDMLVGYTNNSDWSIKSSALRSLALIGDPKAVKPLADALATTSNYEKAMVISWNLLHARKIAESGKKAEGTAIANSIKTLAGGTAQLGGSRGNKHAITAADITLAEIQAITVNIDKKTSPKNKNKLEMHVVPGKELFINIIVEDSFEIKISNINGGLIWSKNGDGSNSFSLAKSLFKPGVYLVDAISQGKSHSRLIIFR